MNGLLKKSRIHIWSIG